MKVVHSCCLALLLLLVVGTPGAYAQYHVIKFDALGLFNKRPNLSFERSFLNRGSVGLAYGSGNIKKIMTISPGGASGEVYNLDVKGFIGELRYYPFHKRLTAPIGFFIGPAFRYATIYEAFTPRNIELKGKVFNYGLATGYKFKYEILVSEILIGYGSGKISDDFMDANRSLYADYYDEDDYDTITRHARLELSIGVIFPQMKTNTLGNH